MEGWRVEGAGWRGEGLDFSVKFSSWIHTAYCRCYVRCTVFGNNHADSTMHGIRILGCLSVGGFR